MSLFAVLALAIGFADLARGAKIRGVPSVVPVMVGAIITTLVGVLAALTSVTDILLLLVIIIVLIGWVVFGDRALQKPTSRVWAGAAVTVLAVGAAATVGFSGGTTPVGGAFADWLHWTAFPRLPGVATVQAPTQVLLIAGLLMVQLATGNLLVRLTLCLSGAPEASAIKDEPATRLKGGRMIGPMERLCILGLGLAGEPTAAGIVIAAKGLIRWPELQAVRDAKAEHIDAKAEHIIDAVTEYFLVGSFASWLVALASLAIVRLAWT